MANLCVAVETLGTIDLHQYFKRITVNWKNNGQNIFENNGQSIFENNGQNIFEK